MSSLSFIANSIIVNVYANAEVNNNSIIVILFKSLFEAPIDLKIR
jgi:hypothetical protein